MPNRAVEDRWAVVTGASSVIGLEVARSLSEIGYSLILQGARHANALELLADELGSRGRRPVVVRANLASERGVDHLMATIRERTSHLDALCWLAAAGVMRPVSALSLHHLEWTFRVTAGSFAVVTAGLRPRVSIAVSSLGSQRIAPEYAAIGAAKSALETLVRYLAVELAPASSVFGLRVGLIDTPAARRLSRYEELEALLRRRAPMGRLVTPEDVAAAVVTMVTEMSSMASGSFLTVDGGVGLVL